MKPFPKFGILNYLIFVCAVLAIISEYAGARVVFFGLKPLTTLLIIALFMGLAKVRGSIFSRCILMGLLACLAGDIFLLDDALFVYGLSAFLVAHICFTIAFCSMGGLKLNWWVLFLLSLFAGALYWWIFPYLASLSLPVAVYIICIVIMAWQGICLALYHRSSPSYCIAVASLLFMFSDSVIAINKFVYPFDGSSAVILLSYWLSITLMANAASYIDNNSNQSKIPKAQLM